MLPTNIEPRHICLYPRETVSCDVWLGVLGNPGHVTAIFTVFDPLQPCLPPSLLHQVLQTPPGQSTLGLDNIWSLWDTRPDQIRSDQETLYQHRQTWGNTSFSFYSICSDILGFWSTYLYLYGGEVSWGVYNVCWYSLYLVYKS